MSAVGAPQEGGSAGRAASVALSASVLSRALALIRLLVVARLMSPSDLGLFLIAVSVLGAFELTASVAIRDLITARHVLDDSFLASAWTIQFLRGCALSGVIASMALAARDWFPDVAGLVLILAWAPALKGFSSLEPVLRRRKLQLLPDASVLVFGQAAETCAAVALTMVLRDPAALAYALLIGQVALATGSYMFGGFRTGPRNPRRHVREVVAYGKWRYGSGLLWYISTSADTIIVGAAAGAFNAGVYRTASNVAHLPATAITGALESVAFPALAQLHRAAPSSVPVAFVRYFSSVLALVLPVTAWLMVGSSTIVFVTLGDQWRAAVIPLQLLALAGLLRTIAACGGQLLLARNDLRAELGMQVVRASAVLILIFPLSRYWGASGAALAATLSCVALVVSTLRPCARAGIRPQLLGKALIRRMAPAVAAAMPLVLGLQFLESPEARVVTLAAFWPCWLLAFRLLDVEAWHTLMSIVRKKRVLP